jgi:serine/threonine-protein kinase
MPHDANERVCPNTGLRIDPRAELARSRTDGARVRSRIDELPSTSRDEPTFSTRAAALAAKSTGPRELINSIVGGRYRIRGVLGQGGMGTVYDAEHLGLSREVAIKVLSPSQAKKRVAVKRFQQEARAAGAIGHPNICEVYDLGLLDDGSPYLVMEKLTGQTLADRIAKEGPLPFGDVVECVAQVLSGLIAAHEKGIVHRDIKPENIFLAQRVGAPPIIKLLDFGVSKMMVEFQNGEEALDLTRTGMVMGTPYYMSPEQARGERNLDGRVDVYACGVVMYEAIAGKRPFLAPNYNALLLAIINTTPRSLHDYRPSTPPELEAIIRHAMEKNRDARYPNAQTFLRDLKPSVPVAAPSRPRVQRETGSGRLPPPPSPADERRRAPAVAGSRGSRPDSSTRATRASGKLRSRSSPQSPQEDETRVDVRPRVTSDSIDIPIHVEALVQANPDEMFDDPTEVFRGGKHLRMRPAPPPPSPADDWEGETAVIRPDIPPAPPSRTPRRR